jgi:hypothetical protein
MSIVLAVMLIGCAPPSDLVEVTGAVTWNGAPMPSGMVVLEPVDPSQPPTGGKIENGAFRLQTKPGKFAVRIEAVRNTTERDPETGTLLGEMYIPSRYNRDTELKAEITRDRSNHFDFPLTNQAPP